MADTTSTALSTPLGLAATDVIDVVETIANAFIPGGGTILGFTITQIANLALGVANEVPEMVDLYDEIKAAASPGATAPTADQWAAWGLAADNAHAAVAAAVAKVLAGG